MTSLPMENLNQTSRWTRRTGARSGQYAINRAYFFVLLALVALAPLPLASNRPVLWGVIAVIIGLACLSYVLLLAWRGEPLRVGIARLKWPALAMGLVAVALLLQVLPFGAWFGWYRTLDLPEGSIVLDTASVAPGMTWLMLTRQLAYALFVFLALQVLANSRRRRLMLDGLLAIVMAYALYGMIALHSGDTVLGMDKWAYHGMATGTFVNRNSFSTFLAMGTVIASVQFAGRISERSHQHADDGRIVGNTGALLFYGLSILFLLMAILATQSRMGLVAAIIGATLGLFMMASKGKGLRSAILLGVPALALAGLYAILTSGELLFDRLLQAEGAASDRTGLYAQVLDMIALRPWTGWGGGSFEAAFPLVHQLPVSADYVWSRAHNTYLALWSELGIVAGSIPILLVAAGFVAIAIRFRGSRSRLDTAPQAAAIAVTVTCAVHSLADFSLEVAANTLIFLAILACGLATIWQPIRQGKP